MCIGIPMKVAEPMGLTARVSGRNGSELVDLRLVGEVERGQWLLVFQGAARERLDAQRAAEIDAALDLLQAGLAGEHDVARPADPGFALPSAMSAEELAALTRPR